MGLKLKDVQAIKAQVALLAASPAFRAQSGVTSEEAAKLCANVLTRIGGMDGFDKDGKKITRGRKRKEEIREEDKGKEPLINFVKE